LDSNFYVPGVNEEEMAKIQQEFAITSMTQLKKLAKTKKIRRLKGLSSKTEMAILRGIKLLEKKPEYLPIGIAKEFANTLITKLLAWSPVSQVLLVGDLRRGVEEVNCIELLIEGEANELVSLLLNLPGLENLKNRDKNKLTFATKVGIPVNIHFSSSKIWGTQSIMTTGSQTHLAELNKLTKGKLPDGATEAEVYDKLMLPLIPPEIRETGYEIQFAQDGILPELIDLASIKGDLHIHSRWSDGVNTIEEIIQKGLKLGYQYLAITDHSQSLKVAGGLQPEDLYRQIEEINKLQLKYPQLKILKGIEVDILEDGSLDFTDDILKKLDLVIASIHSNFHLSQDAMTYRIIKALKHPLVNILAHPTGRVLGKRPGYQVNIGEVIKVAAQYKKVLEVNASPDRLDLRDKHLQLAKIEGVKIVINTDAHIINRMEDMIFGVQTAKRGWQTKNNILNSWSYEKVLNFLKNKEVIQ